MDPPLELVEQAVVEQQPRHVTEAVLHDVAAVLALEVAGTPSRLGELLRYWRRVRRTSQLDLASQAQTTRRYVSFVETGRSQPTRQMILRLARALEVPLRERNGLLVAAGYAPMYREEDLSAPELDRVELALSTMLGSHDPFPAVVMDRGWNILRANQGARRLFDRLLHPQPIPDPANVLRLMIEPSPVQRSVLNWTSVVQMLLERARREAVGGVLDRDTAALVERLCELPDVALSWPRPEAEGSAHRRHTRSEPS
jgi:transcriptional regulator with XRE-family HTH domain